MNILLGSNDFFGVPFPLVLADRFFHIYSVGNQFSLDLFRWDEQAKQAVYEVRAGQPQDENIDTNPTGIVTFSEPTTGTFLYKFRPKPGISQIFGKVPMNEEIQVRISDREIVITRGDSTIATFKGNQLKGINSRDQLSASK